jgi:hypothetical protein
MFESAAARQAAIARAVGARDEAVGRVAENAPHDWMRLARMTVLRVAAELPTFTTDDVWHELQAVPPEPRALGAVMKSLSAEGRIRPLPTWVQSTRAECHARPIRVWQAS